MSIDVFDVTYCKASNCPIANSCGRCLARFIEFWERQHEAIATEQVIVTDFSLDKGVCEVFLDPMDVRT